ncbi:glycosyltransferase [Tunicatimonas pelagia]|uniref:glycosyltransferase n=1 Tax=Tunicatimonas pelagia TaxID=931531 RepID=UPI002665B1BD|nr:glycosyltransferase [Tunicatimonas pelagia]WKN40441.1 glycosyltransferase [Tunicatimonas pelagia]
MNAPIALFAYKRLDTLKRTVSALQQNVLARESDLFIFSDAAKTQADELAVNNIRDFLKTIEGFRSIRISEAKANQGLAKSIISGATEVLNSYDTVIVLEDDLAVSSNFLSFMNQCLSFYSNYPEVLSVSGYTMPMEVPEDYSYDVYAFPRVSSHGWATWKSKWVGIDWEIKDFDKFKQSATNRKDFRSHGSDLYRMLSRQMQGKIDSWAIRWQYHLYKEKLFTIYPTISKVENIGFGAGATHTTGFDRFTTKLDKSDSTAFQLLPNVASNKKIHEQFMDFYSVKSRGIAKLKQLIGVLR